MPVRARAGARARSLGGGTPLCPPPAAPRAPSHAPPATTRWQRHFRARAPWPLLLAGVLAAACAPCAAAQHADLAPLLALAANSASLTANWTGTDPCAGLWGRTLGWGARGGGGGLRAAPTPPQRQPRASTSSQPPLKRRLARRQLRHQRARVQRLAAGCRPEHCADLQHRCACACESGGRRRAPPSASANAAPGADCAHTPPSAPPRQARWRRSPTWTCRRTASPARCRRSWGSWRRSPTWTCRPTRLQVRCGGAWPPAPRSLRGGWRAGQLRAARQTGCARARRLRAARVGDSAAGLAALGNCSGLTHLLLGSNGGLTGAWPDEWGALASLAVLRAGATNVSGAAAAGPARASWRRVARQHGSARSPAPPKRAPRQARCPARGAAWRRSATCSWTRRAGRPARRRTSGRTGLGWVSLRSST